ncbi:MAG: DNA repair and recombination protein RadB [Candidatus Altiarchaeota archaeon]|nr:DNA repair and recombination protein RadB [Candidatus Altiarchaeota archaeon]
MVSIHRAFDDFLGGGLLPGVLTHLYGPPGSGKTNLALMATANAVGKGKVLYIDSEGGFSVERIKQITGGSLDAVMENVLLVKPTTFSEQQAAIRRLDGMVKEQPVALIVVDSIGNLFRLEDERDAREFGKQLALLLRIARKYEIPILLTNQVFTDIDNGRLVPIGGRVNEYWNKIMVELGREGQVRFAVIRKHLFKPEGLKFEFTIVSSGIDVLGETPTNFNVKYVPK